MDTPTPAVDLADEAPTASTDLKQEPASTTMEAEVGGQKFKIASTSRHLGSVASYTVLVATAAGSVWFTEWLGREHHLRGSAVFWLDLMAVLVVFTAGWVATERWSKQTRSDATTPG